MKSRKEKSSLLLLHPSITSTSYNVPIRVDRVLESGLVLHGLDCMAMDWTEWCQLNCIVQIRLLALTGLYGANWTVWWRLDCMASTGLRKQRRFMHSIVNKFHHQQTANLISLKILSNRFKYTLRNLVIQYRPLLRNTLFAILDHLVTVLSSGEKRSDKVNKPNSGCKDAKWWVSVHCG